MIGMPTTMPNVRRSRRSCRTSFRRIARIRDRDLHAACRSGLSVTATKTSSREGVDTSLVVALISVALERFGDSSHRVIDRLRDHDTRRRTPSCVTLATPGIELREPCAS